MRMIGYCRVSSKSQEDNTSLDEQQRKIELHADMHGHELVACLSDVCTGTLLGRKGLWFALRKLVCTACVPQYPPPGMVRKEHQPLWVPAVDELLAPCGCDNPQPADGLIVWTLDRLSRNSRHITMLVHDVLAARKKVFVAMSGLGQCDTTTPGGRLILDIFAALAQFDRECIREKLMTGMAAKKRAGGYASGGPPFGWYAVNGKLHPHEFQQQVLRYIHKLSAGGCSQRQIADILNADGIKTSRGKQWNHNQVYRVLHGPGQQCIQEQLREIWASAEELGVYPGAECEAG